MAHAKNIIKNKSFIYSMTVLAVLGIGIVTTVFLVNKGVISNPLKDKDVLAIVGTEKITKRDLSEQIYGQEFKGSVEEPSDTSKEEKEKILNKLIEWKIANIKAAKDGITVSDKELDDYIKANLKSYDQYNDEQKKITRDTSYNSLLLKKVEDAVVGWKEGSYILVNFSKNFASDAGFSEAEKAKEDVGRDQRVKEDTTYAKTLIDSIYADIQSDKMTFEQGMEKAKNDSRLGIPGYEPSHVLQSDSFTREEFISQQKIFGLDEAKDKIANLKIDQLSEPTVLKVAVSDEKGAEELRDGIWMIAIVKESKTGENSSYEEWLEGQMKELNVRKFNENLGLNLLNSSKVYASSGAHDCGDGYQSHWGVNTGSSSSTAGLVVTTHYYTATGAYYELNGVTVNINDYSGSGGAYGGKGIFLTPNGTITNRLSSANFTTGEAFYYNNFQTAPTCYRNSALILGYGSTSGAGRNGHFGNGYTLGCKESYTVSVISSGPGAYGGYWTGGESWNGAAKNISVSNGSTLWRGFDWHMYPNSAPNAYHSAPSNGAVLAAGTTSYTLRGKGDDPNSETVRLRVRYRSRATDGGSFGRWTTTAYTGLVSDNTVSNIYSLPLANGRTYKWQVQARDSAGLDGGWTGSWSFSVNAPPTATHVSPAHGASFAVGTPAVMLRVIGHDPSNNQIQLRIQYRSRVTDGGVFGGWTANAYSALAGDDSNRDIYNLPVSNGRTYEWQVQAKDGRGAEGPWSGSRNFSISPQSLSVTLERTDAQSNTTDLLRPSLKATATSAGVPTTATYNWIFQRKRSTDASYTECDRYNAADATQNTKTTDRCSFEGTYPATTYNVRVLVERGSLQAYSTPLNITVVKPHMISCNALTAAPSGGTLPLTVTFTAGVVDSWNHAITYLWDFSYDGVNFNSERQTSSNQTSFTFTTDGSQKVAVKGISDISTPVSRCPLTVDFNVNPWSSGDQNEVAP